MKDGRKTQQLGVLAVGSDDTSNILDEDDGFSNIKELLPIQQALLPDLRNLRDVIKPSKSSRGDLISALVVAIEMMERHTRKLKYIRKIVLVTDGSRNMDADDVEQIATKLLDDGIELTVLGVDFDDADFGFKEEDKDLVKAENEETLRSLCENSNGNYGTMAYAVSELGLPRLTQPTPTSLYKGALTLGDPTKYETAMSIQVERYAKVRIAKAPTASSFVVKTGAGTQAGSSTQTSATMQNGNSQAPADDNLTSVKYARTYTVDDPDQPGGKRELEREELARGFEYGRTAVPMEREDEKVTKLETFASFDIVGFVAASEYEHWMSMTETSQTVPSKINQKSAMAFSSLVHALHERDSYAIARLVAKDGRNVQMLLLAPFFDPENNYECLIDVELPFAEDMRSYTFPPLDKIVTVSGKHIVQHRSLPTDALLHAMGDYIDSVDLSSYGRDEEGEPSEYAAIPDTYNTRKNYLEQAIKFRAINHMDAVPPVSETLTKFSHPPEELLQSSKSDLDALIKAADVKKVPPKLKGRKRARDAEKPISGLDVAGLLNTGEGGMPKRTRISSENAVPEFRQILSSTDDMSDWKDAVKQLGTIIEEYIRTSTGSYNYQRAIEAMRVMKEEMSENEEPELYNVFLKGFKDKLEKGELGEGRRELWYLVRVHRLGLIDSSSNSLVEVTPEEAKAVCHTLKSPRHAADLDTVYDTKVSLIAPLTARSGYSCAQWIYLPDGLTSSMHLQSADGRIVESC